MKRPGKNSIMRDAVKRRAMLRFLKRSIAKRGPDGRVGLILCLAWDAGYESGRRRSRQPTAEPAP